MKADVGCSRASSTADKNKTRRGESQRQNQDRGSFYFLEFRSKRRQARGAWGWAPESAGRASLRQDMGIASEHTGMPVLCEASHAGRTTRIPETQVQRGVKIPANPRPQPHRTPVLLTPVGGVNDSLHHKPKNQNPNSAGAGAGCVEDRQRDIRQRNFCMEMETCGCWRWRYPKARKPRAAKHTRAARPKKTEATGQATGNKNNIKTFPAYWSCAK